MNGKAKVEANRQSKANRVELKPVLKTRSQHKLVSCLFYYVHLALFTATH